LELSVHEAKTLVIYGLLIKRRAVKTTALLFIMSGFTQDPKLSRELRELF
jgi:hypothetical protein